MTLSRALPMLAMALAVSYGAPAAPPAHGMVFSEHDVLLCAHDSLAGPFLAPLVNRQPREPQSREPLAGSRRGASLPPDGRRGAPLPSDE